MAGCMDSWGPAICGERLCILLTSTDIATCLCSLWFRLTCSTCSQPWIDTHTSITRPTRIYRNLWTAGGRQRAHPMPARPKLGLQAPHNGPVMDEWWADSAGRCTLRHFVEGVVVLLQLLCKVSKVASGLRHSQAKHLETTDPTSSPAPNHNSPEYPSTHITPVHSAISSSFTSDVFLDLS